MEYAIYPFRHMRISQAHDEGNHVPHWQGVTNYSDKPWDECGKDGGQDYFAPKNDFIIEQVLGINSSTTNTVRLKSVNKLKTPFKEDADYLYVTLTHINESDLCHLSVGQVIKAGEINPYIREGTDGYATGNHFHITANFGKYYGMKQNNLGKWVFCYEKSLLPDEAFYIDKEWTSIKDAKRYNFKEAPKDNFFEDTNKGYYGFGDSSEHIGKVNDFLYNTGLRGTYLGNYAAANIKEFQKQNGLEADGNIGPITYAKLVEKGYTE